MTDNTNDRAAVSDASTDNQSTTTADASDHQAEANGPVESSGADTSSTQARFWLTNDVLASLLVASFVGVFVGGAMGVLDLASVPVEIRLGYLTVSGGAAVWTFGQPAYRTWAEARTGNSRSADPCCCCSR